MTHYPSAQVAYNASGKPFHVEHLLTVKAINKGSGNLITFNFSSLRRTETITVRKVEDGTDSTRTYTGGKLILQSPAVKNSQALTVDEHDFELSGISTYIRDMVFGHYMQRAYFEWHQVQFDKRNGSQPIAVPVCELVGYVDNVSEKRDAKDKSKGTTVTRFVMSTVARHAEFEYQNGSLRSYEEGLKRSGDKFYEHAASVGDWPIGWGKEIHRMKDHGNRGGKGGKGGGGDKMDQSHTGFGTGGGR